MSRGMLFGRVAVFAVLCVGCGDSDDGAGGRGGPGGGPCVTNPSWAGCWDPGTDPNNGGDNYVGKGNNISNYRTVTIGWRKWMAENLDYNVPNNTTDVCYNNSADSYAKYGRLYNWETAKTACPSGWHLPSDDEWTALTDAVGGSSTAGGKLKSTSGWYGNGNGTDEFGFSALPGGRGYSDSYSYGAGNYGYWWSATEDDATYAWGRDMGYGNEYVYRDNRFKTHLFSVRCVQD